MARFIIGSLLVAGLTVWGPEIKRMFAPQAGMAAQLQALDPDVFPAGEREALSRMLAEHVKARRDDANRRDAQAWKRVKTRADWEQFRDRRIEALRRSLGTFPPAPQRIAALAATSIDGESCRIENLVYESRPGVFVTANLYLPATPREKMPAIIIIHSHHNPKTQDELQDMGMTWARQGCAVLVIDQFGHGERRHHPEGRRQDYRFRYFTGVQLDVIGESLMGWMIWDVMRGVDLLLERKDIDKDKVILIGAVAGGGDPAAVMAALDSRITCVVPFNFGGPQPETPYPLPDDAEQPFNYMGDGSWESTRNLRLSGRDGFLPWVIVGAAAPRRLIYAHEFSWDRERDPVWMRLQKIYELYGAPHLAFTHGAGLLSGKPPEATHCNNVGATHRRMIYAALKQWFGMSIPGREDQQRRPADQLMCLTPELKRRLRPRPPHELFGEIGAARAAAMRAQLDGLAPGGQRERLRRAWAGVLGDIEPKGVSRVSQVSDFKSGVHEERIVLEVEPKIVVPLLLLLPPRKENERLPVVIGLSQEGKGRFLRERSEEIAALLAQRLAVCLPDVRGTGETSADPSRAHWSENTSQGIYISSTEWMLGQTLVGSRLRDLRSVLRHLRSRGDVDAHRLALWGESFAATNPPQFDDPLIGEGQPPPKSEPLGGLLALLGALFEDGVRAVASRRTLAGYQAILGDAFFYVPHDAIVPGALTAGDLCDVAAALTPRSLRLEGLLDGRNRELSIEDARRSLGPAIRAYRTTPERLVVTSEIQDDIAEWLVKALR